MLLGDCGFRGHPIADRWGTWFGRNTLFAGRGSVEQGVLLLRWPRWVLGAPRRGTAHSGRCGGCGRRGWSKVQGLQAARRSLARSGRGLAEVCLRRGCFVVLSVAVTRNAAEEPGRWGVVGPTEHTLITHSQNPRAICGSGVCWQWVRRAVAVVCRAA